MSSNVSFIAHRTTGLLFIVSAPAGTGKSTLVDMLTREFPHVKRSISCTTRPPRTGERDGIDYYFLSEEAFQQKVDAGKFLEHVALFGYRYGTLADHIEEQQAKGNHVVLVIDTQGALLLLGKVKATFIFVMPPTLEELARRLSERGSETKESMATRLAEAEREIACATSYNYVIVNDDKARAYEVLRSIVIAEDHKIT